MNAEFPISPIGYHRECRIIDCCPECRSQLQIRKGTGKEPCGTEPAICASRMMLCND
jgi:hypothetical protein